MKTHAHVDWMRTLGNFSYLLGVAFLIAAMAVNATPALRARAVNTTLTCPLPLYDAGHYALQQGQTVTCTINDAIFIGSPTTLRVYIVHPTLGTIQVTGTVSGTTITFSYTGRGNGCDTEFIKYSDNDGHNKTLSGLAGFGYPAPCGSGPTSTPTNTPSKATNTPTATATTTAQPGPSTTPTSTGQPGPSVTPSATTTPSGSGPTSTPNPNDPGTPLIPVTGVSLGGGWSAQTIFFNLGIGFLGLGLVLNGLARSRRELEV
jgi:hypothetical protein